MSDEQKQTCECPTGKALRKMMAVLPAINREFWAENERLVKELVALRVKDAQREEAIHRMRHLSDARDIDDASTIRKLETERDSLRARVEALEADKVRLDWMDANGGTEPMRAWSMMHARYMWQWMGRRFDTLREAIDAATPQPQEKGTPKT